MLLMNVHETVGVRPRAGLVLMTTRAQVFALVCDVARVAQGCKIEPASLAVAIRAGEDRKSVV